MTRLKKLSPQNRWQNRWPLPHLLWVSGLWLIALPALAQAPSEAVPSAQDLLAPVAPAVEPQPAEAPPLESVAPPAPPKSVDLELSSPGQTEASPANPPLISPNLVEQAQSSFGSSLGQSSLEQSATNRFIDSTPYSLGATDNPSVVLSERSTGCETVVQPGQAAPSSICGSSGAAPSWNAAADGGGSGEMSLGVVYGGRVTPSGKDFYNLTLRPAAKISSAAINFLFPLSIPAAITSAFGWRVHPVMGESRFHTGTDLGAPEGTPVLAAFAGKVAVADFMGGYGLTVVLQHQNGSEETLYGHMSEIFVKPGETVKQGEVIGRVGSTGLSTGPHLHFEFRKQTPSGWVVMDAGGAIDSALNQFVSALKLGIAYPPQLALIRSASFTKALEMAEAQEPSAVPKSLPKNLPESAPPER
ncbi:M23 family metallopeptidase [Rivularia sp. UHCC 0363]|uniref:M23 family metallopeptidase n=1 Tax=Rivularia sp. UHCC 0363 TaxID=3110244 RepID=UPI002B202DDC|nr:peptidoglycan DD-metalloendopeptidase family protein [Rivularia sp. UHCC 0363]MEA5597340.1 peptidoglycan DD-metalloendopeptidase family protein [Rivularia sp. UHCC 0363]